jgi:hypothetical protein
MTLSESAQIRGESEMSWVKVEPLLSSKGYQLRPRYQSDWIPSWITNPHLPTYKCEDHLSTGLVATFFINARLEQLLILGTNRIVTFWTLFASLMV